MQATSYADVQAALTNPDLTVPPASEASTGIAWLRSSVARFSTGPAHTRRRALAVTQISTIDIQKLRSEAQYRTTATLALFGDTPIDLMSTVARTLPTELLAAALGIPGATPAAIAAIARAYPTGNTDPEADAAVEDLRGTVDDEATAARIALLAQSFDATAGVIGNAAFIMLRDELRAPAEAIIAETLRHTPPVRVTKRVTATGDTVEINLATANRDPAVFPAPDDFDPTRANRDVHLDFGFGPHACPGRHVATAIAAGVLDAIRAYHLLTQAPTYAPPANLRIPTHLTITPTKPEIFPNSPHSPRPSQGDDPLSA
ncbi:MAG TPA: cytochrome P450 [Pseudonocardiaceae bacterium]|nr:cytochrome P450 [Pseudonocardiaceae bacterium]